MHAYPYCWGSILVQGFSSLPLDSATRVQVPGVALAWGIAIPSPWPLGSWNSVRVRLACGALDVVLSPQPTNQPTFLLD